jgi:hypothetical protein
MIPIIYIAFENMNAANVSQIVAIQMKIYHLVQRIPGIYLERAVVMVGGFVIIMPMKFCFVLDVVESCVMNVGISKENGQIF